MQYESSADLGPACDIETCILEISRSLADLDASLDENTDKETVARAHHQLNALEDQLNSRITPVADNTTELESKLQAYQQHESILLAILNHTHIGVSVVTGSDGIFKFVNNAYLRMIPYPNEHLVEKTLAKVWPTEEGWKRHSPAPASKAAFRISTTGKITSVFSGLFCFPIFCR